MEIIFSKNSFHIETYISLHQQITMITWYIFVSQSKPTIKWFRYIPITKISWIYKNRKNFAKYFMLVCYALFVLSTARINVKNNLISTYPPWKLCKRCFPLPGTFSNFSQFFSFPFFTWHVLQFCKIKEFVICTC